MKILPIALLALCISGFASAQTKEKSNKEETITIHKKNNTKEKITIIIDGDKVLVNGKPLEDLKDADIEVFHNRDYGPLISKLKGRIAPMGGMKMFGDGF